MSDNWWDNGVIYQIYPRSFLDTGNDGIGDLKGITQKLDYVASLGIDAIWISPFFKSPMKDFGYDVSDYYTVDPIFGTNEDFYELLEQANKRNLKVMVDLVVAHTSDQHPWFLESKTSRDNPKSDWYAWSDPKPDGSAPNNWISVFGGPAWSWNSGRAQYYHHQFLREQPALNLNNPEVVAEMFRNIQFWIDKGVKGFRLDAIYHAFYDMQLRDNPANPDALKNRHPDPYRYQLSTYSHTQPEAIPFLQAMRVLADKHPDVCLLGEIGSRKTARAYTGKDKLHTSYFYDLIKLTKYDAAEIKSIVSGVTESFPESDYCWAWSNHDFARHVSRLNPDIRFQKEFAKAASTLFLTLPGGYCMYQGEELGLPAADLTYEELVDPFDKVIWPHGQQRDRSRTPMPWQKNAENAGFCGSARPWLPVPAPHKDLAVDVQEKDSESMLTFTRDLLKWRNASETIKHGGFAFLQDAPETVIAFTRSRGNQQITCLFNTKSDPATVKVKGEMDLISRNASHDGETATLLAYGFALINH